MDTRGATRSSDPARTLVEVSTDTGRVQLVELSHARYVVASRGSRDLGAMLSMLVVIGAVMAIAIFAIATSAGWSVVLGA